MTAITDQSQIGEWLDSHGADHLKTTIALHEIDDRASLRNQARFQALDERLVVTYSEAFGNNAQFPPIVVARAAHGLLVIDGNHRVAAARLAGKTSLPAYIVSNATERQIHVLTFDANTKHGMPTTPEERKAHAVYLVDTAGVTQKDAAQMLNVPLRELNNEIVIGRVSRRLASLGLDRWEDIGRGARRRMENVRNDTVLKAFADIVIRAKLGQAVVDDTVTEINKETTTEAQLAIVDNLRVANEAQMRLTIGGRTSVPLPVLRLQRSVSYAMAIVVDALDPSAFDADMKAGLRTRIDEAIDRLRSAKERLG